ncbi:hypothetical protein ACFLW0_05385 [Chloroflexota bacterium]
MAETKYGKYLVREPLGKGGLFPMVLAYGGRELGGANFSIRVHYPEGADSWSA